jgi:hypothetical protein
MWSMLVEISGAWYGIHVPLEYRTAWGDPIQPPPGVRVELCLDRHAARRLRHDIASSAYDPTSTAGTMTVFAGCGVAVPDEYARERDGMDFLRRQAEHITGPDQHLIVISIQPNYDPDLWWPDDVRKTNPS